MALKVFASEELTVDASSGGVQFAFLATATDEEKAAFRMAHIVIDGADVRVTEDGTAPVAGGPGKLVKEFGSFEIWGWRNLENLKLIQEAAVSALAEVTFEGTGNV